jgi:hypothetical protein
MKTCGLGYEMCEEYHSKWVRGRLPCHRFRYLALDRADTFACSDGHDSSRLWVNMSCPYWSSFSWSTTTPRTPLVFVSVADKGVTSEEKSPESKNASRGAGVFGFWRDVTQAVLYAIRHFLSSVKAEKSWDRTADGRKEVQTRSLKPKAGHLTKSQRDAAPKRMRIAKSIPPACGTVGCLR